MNYLAASCEVSPPGRKTLRSKLRGIYPARNKIEASVRHVLHYAFGEEFPLFHASLLWTFVMHVTVSSFLGYKTKPMYRMYKWIFITPRCA
jgi:hypothetical protein